MNVKSHPAVIQSVCRAHLMSRVIRENKFDVRYNAYKYLQKHGDTSIIRTIVAEDFYINQTDYH